jgi:hypothetical protein
MLSLFSLLLLSLVVLDVVRTGQAHETPRRLVRASSLRSIVRRQTSQNTTTTSPTASSNPNVTLTSAGIVPLVLASDKQCVLFCRLHCRVAPGSRKARICRTYYCVISAGNISFRVAVDTGSSDFWVVSSNCTASQCKSLPKYPLTYASPSFVSVNNNATSFDVRFADTTCVYLHIRFAAVISTVS